MRFLVQVKISTALSSKTAGDFDFVQEDTAGKCAAAGLEPGYFVFRGYIHLNYCITLLDNKTGLDN